MNTIFAIDGNWYLHRCYYSLASSKADITNTTTFSRRLNRLFISLICKDALKVKATYALVAFDGAFGFRYKIYPQYKATRKSHQKQEDLLEKTNQGDGLGITEKDDIYQYLPSLIETLTILKIPYVQNEAFEADDVLASCTSCSYYKDSKVVLGTKDKDCFQVLDKEGRVTIYDSSYKKDGKPKPRTISWKVLEKKFGSVLPNQLIDYQTLVGDKIDNIPALMRPLTAKKILHDYGSIANAIKEGNEAVRNFLIKNAVALGVNQALVSLYKNLSLPHLQALKIQRIEMDDETKKYLPTSYFDYLDFCCPKASLF